VSVIPCEKNKELRAAIARFADALKTEAHTLGDHGLSEAEFYQSPLLRGAIEQVRGEFSATMRGKREFVQHVLNHMEDAGFIASWDRAKRGARNDYRVHLKSGRSAVIDLKGCLDGNNTNIFERPKEADEFVIWSLCTNAGADPRLNAWSGVHTRLSAEILSRSQRVDGLLIWDMICGTVGRPCPKLGGAGAARLTAAGPFRVPPPCIYLFPESVPSPAQPKSLAQSLDRVELLAAFQACFLGRANEVNSVDIEADFSGDEVMRRTTVRRGDIVQHASELTAIRRV